MPIKRNYTSNEVNKIIELYTNKLTLSEIGDYFKTSKNPIKRVLKENNIKIRTSGTQKGKPSKLKGIPKSESHKFNMRKPKYSNRLLDGSFYPSIPDLCHCKSHCNEIVYNGHDYIVGHQFRGMKRSEEWKKQQSERMLSDKNHLRGKKLSEEHKENIKKSASHISGKDHWLYGKSLSEEHIKHLKKSARRGDDHPKPWLGKHLSDEHKKNISVNSPHLSGEDHPMYGKCGDKHWNYGKHHSDETKEKIRKNTPILFGEDHPSFGKHPSQETLNKMSIAQKESYERNPERKLKNSGKNSYFYGKPPKHGRVYIYQSPLQGEVKLIGSYEYKYVLYLDSNNIPWYYEPKAFPLNLNGKETTYTPDFYLPSTDEYIEVKGWWRDDAEEKFNKFKETYPEIKIQLLMKKELKNLGIKI